MKKKKSTPSRKNNRFEKKKLVITKKNSFDIKTNPTLLGKKTKPLFSSEKILWEKKIGKKQKKENHSLKKTSLLKTFVESKSSF